MKKVFLLLPAILILFGAGCQKIKLPINAEPKKNITITSPKAGEIVSLPFIIKGQARVFENQFNIRIKDSADFPLYEEMIMSDAPDAGIFGNYEKEIKYLQSAPKDENLTIEVFDYSAKDGSEQDMVSIPVKLKNTETYPLKLFFNRAPYECEDVKYLTRNIPLTPSIGVASINLLLEGPTEKDKELGFFTSINAGVKLQKLTIENGTATADFNEQLDFQLGGSCRVSAIRAQITETLKQFSSVKNVVISVNGRTEDILQP
jgi:hypothetical protein